MKYKSFQSFYELEISKPIAKLKLKLKSYRKNYVLFAIALTIILTLPFYVFLAKYYQITILSMLVFIAMFAFIIRFASFPENERLEYKRIIIQKIIHKIDPSFQYRALDSIFRGEIAKSKLLPNHMNAMTGEDYISGKIQKTDFYASEIFARYERRSDDNPFTWKENIFHGIFFCG